MIGGRIKYLRIAKGLSQKGLADALGTSQGYICDLELNKKQPGSDFLISLKRFFNLDINWLLMGEEKEIVAEPSSSYEHKSPVVKKIDQMLEVMDEEAQRDVLKYCEKTKHYEEMKREKKKAGNGG